MGNVTVQHHKFIVKAGMTVDDIIKSKDATSLQKKYAFAFDTDKNGFSKSEADLFNATTFSEKSDGTVTFWTRQANGNKKGTKFDSKDKDIKYINNDEVKPYVKNTKVKKAAVNKTTTNQDKSVSFFDEKWSGQQIAKLTGNNDFTDWLQNKDKVCTDGHDDGHIGIVEGAKSVAKGLFGGLIKTAINHPILTGAAIAVASSLSLPALTAIGIVCTVGTIGYGAYKAATSKTDGETKQAFETIGLGISTGVLSTKSAQNVIGKGVNKVVHLYEKAKASVTTLSEAETTNVIEAADIINNAQANSKVLYKIVPEGTKYMSANGVATTRPNSALIIDKNGNVTQTTIESLLKDPKLTDNETTDILSKMIMNDPKGAAQYYNNMRSECDSYLKDLRFTANKYIQYSCAQ